MKSHRRPAVVACLIALASLVPAAEDKDWSRYESIVESSIFDPDRGAETPPPRRRTPEPEPTVTLTLTGTMIRDAGPVAFFEGSALSGPLSVSEGDILVGMRVADIGLSEIQLRDAASTATLATLPVGSSLSRTGDKPWKPLSGVLPSSERSASDSETSIDSGEEDESGLSVLERLRQRRQRELR